MKKYILFSIVALSVLLSSCETDLNIPLPKHEEKMVLNSFLQPAERVSVNLSHSYAINTTQSIEKVLVSGASMKLFEDGIEVATFVEQDTTVEGWLVGAYTQDFVKIVQYNAGIFRPELGKNYEIKATHSSYPDVSAKTNLVSEAKIKAAKLKLYAGKEVDVDGFTYDQHLLSLTIEDPGDMAHYYQIVAKGAVEVKDGSGGIFLDTSKIYIEGPVLRETGTGYLRSENLWVADEGRNGQTFTIDFLVQPQIYGGGPGGADTFSLKTIFITLQAVNQDTYEYFKKFTLQQNTGGDISFFPAESIVVPSNIKGGYGIFGAMSTVRDTFPL